MANVKIHKVAVLPTVWDVNAVYYVKIGTVVSTYVTDNVGTPFLAATSEETDPIYTASVPNIFMYKSAITTGADLNTYIVTGFYGASNAVSGTVTNTPQAGSPFILEVIKNSSLYTIQRATYNGNVSYRRFSGDGGTTWSTWAKILFAADVILNQNTSAQASSNFYISGSGRMSNLTVNYGNIATGTPIATFSQNGGSIQMANGTGSAGNFVPIVRGIASTQNSWGINLMGSGFDSYSQAAIVLRGVNTGNTGIVTSGKLFAVQNYTTEYLSIGYDGIVKMPALSTATSGVAYSVFTDAGGTIGKRGMNNFSAQTSFNFDTANTVGEYAFVLNSGATGAPQATAYSYYLGFGGGDVAGRGAQIAITRTDNNFYFRTIDSATAPVSTGGWIKLASQAWVISQGYVAIDSVIQNQNAVIQSANFRIDGYAQVGTGMEVGNYMGVYGDYTNGSIYINPHTITCARSGDSFTLFDFQGAGSGTVFNTMNTAPFKFRYNNDLNSQMVFDQNLMIGVTDSYVSTGERLQVNGSIRQTAVTSTMIKADSTGKIVAATAGTDYLDTGSVIQNQTATTQSAAFKIDGTGESITTLAAPTVKVNTVEPYSGSTLTLSASLLKISNMAGGVANRSVVVDSTGSATAGPVLESGTYTPTVTGDATFTVQGFTYQRIGSIVSVMGRLVCSSISASTMTASITLPIASNLDNAYDLLGTISGNGIGSSPNVVIADGATNKAFLTAATSGGISATIYVFFQYQIL